MIKYFLNRRTCGYCFVGTTRVLWLNWPRLPGFFGEVAESGRMYRTRNAAYRKVPWVRIPPSPPFSLTNPDKLWMLANEPI